jgi:hypothetical protein
MIAALFAGALVFCSLAIEWISGNKKTEVQGEIPRLANRQGYAIALAAPPSDVGHD